MRNDLPNEEESFPRRLIPIEDTCVQDLPDRYGCESPKNAICLSKTSKGSKKTEGRLEYNSECFDFDTVPIIEVGQTLPLPGYKDKSVVVACGPCECFPDILDPNSVTKAKRGAATLQCPKECACKNGAPFFILNPAIMKFEDHDVFARLVGCQLASIHNADEQAAAEAALASLPSGDSNLDFVFIGLIKYPFTEQGPPRIFTFAWSDYSGTFKSEAGPNDNSPEKNSYVYTNWLKDSDPNGGTDPTKDNEPYGGLYTFDSSFAWVDVQDLARPALYKCCHPDLVSMVGCSVPAPMPELKN